MFSRGTLRLDKYLNIESLLEKSLKSVGESLYGIDKYWN